MHDRRYCDAVHNQHHSNAAVEGAQHLFLGELRDALQPAEHRGQGPLGTCSVQDSTQVRRQHSGNVVGQSPAGDVSHGLDELSPRQG